MKDHLPEAMSLGHLLVQVSRLVGARLRRKMAGLGLHRAQGQILFFLWHEDGLPQHSLARALHIRPATATNTLQRMERDGWIERQRDEADQRLVRVHLTGRAEALREEVQRSFRQLDEEMAAALTAEEREVLRDLLLKVRGRLLPAEQTGHPAGHHVGRRGAGRRREGQGEGEGQ